MLTTNMLTTNPPLLASMGIFSQNACGYSGANRVAEAGAYLYLTMLWGLGWGFLWLMLNGVS